MESIFSYRIQIFSYRIQISLAERIFEELGLCRKRLVSISRPEGKCAAGNVNTKSLRRCLEQPGKGLTIIERVRTPASLLN